MKNSIIKYVAVSVAAVSLASCGSFVANGPETALTVQEEHPISVDSQVITLTLNGSGTDGALSDMDQARLNAFANSYMRNGHGPISITTPSSSGGHSGAVRIASEAREALYQAGISKDVMQATSYAAGSSSSNDVIITYTHYVATPSACGIWEGVRTRDYQNRRSPNFGCAQQSNLAAMIVDPRDLVAPAEMTAPDTAIRIRGVRAFREGDVTSTQADARIDAQVSN